MALRPFGGEEEIEFVEGAGPVFAEEAGEGAVGKELSAGLARRAIVGFVGSVANALDRGVAARAGLFVAAVNGHAFAEGGDLLGEFAGGFGAEAIGPLGKRGADGFEEALDFRDGELLRERERRKPRLEQNLIRVGIADAAEQTRIGEGTLESVVGGEKRGGKASQIGIENFEAAGIESAKAVFSRDAAKSGRRAGASATGRRSSGAAPAIGHLRGQCKCVFQGGRGEGPSWRRRWQGAGSPCAGEKG